MVPDVVPREVIALAGVHPSNRSLKTTKDALVGLFHGFPHPLNFLGVNDFRVSNDREQLLPFLTSLREAQRLVLLRFTLSIRLLRLFGLHLLCLLNPRLEVEENSH